MRYRLLHAALAFLAVTAFTPAAASAATESALLFPSTRDVVFDFVPVGSTAESRSVTVTNRGQQPTAVKGVELNGLHRSDFALDASACVGKRLEPMAACTFDVRFTPTAAGTRVAEVKISDGDDCLQYVRLAGSGDAGTPTATTSSCGGPPQVTAEQQVLGTVAFPAAASCQSRRNFTVTINRPKGVTLKRVEVKLDGKRLKVIRGRAIKARVDLRGLPQGRFKLQVTIRTSGKTIRQTRHYVTCIKSA